MITATKPAGSVAQNGRTRKTAVPAPTQAPEKLLPQNVEAEAAVLGSLLIDPGAIGEVAEILRAEDFYREAHRTIFQAALDLAAAGEPADLITLSDELARRGKLEELGGVSSVSALANQVPTSANVAYYARIVHRCAINRQLIHAATQIAAVAYDEPDADAALAEAQKQLAEVEQQSLSFGSLSFGDGAEDAFFSLTDLMKRQLPEPRWVVPGILPEGLSLLCGKPKMGKSWLAFALELATGSGGRALGSIPVEQGEALYLALEDNQRRLQKRAKQLLGDERPPEGVTIATRWPRLDAGGLVWLERWLAAHPTTRIICIDTLAMVRPEQKANASIYAEDYAALGGLKQLADKYQVAIVLIHHLRKMSAGDPLDEISGSTGLTGAVDNILVMRRERGSSDAQLHITGRDVDEQELVLTFDATRGQWNLAGTADEYGRTKNQTAVLAALRDAGGPLGINEIAYRTSKRYEETKALVWRMEQERLIVKTDRGIYAASAVSDGVEDDSATADHDDLQTSRTSRTFVPSYLPNFSPPSPETPEALTASPAPAMTIDHADVRTSRTLVLSELSVPLRAATPQSEVRKYESSRSSRNADAGEDVHTGHESLDTQSTETKVRGVREGGSSVSASGIPTPPPGVLFLPWRVAQLEGQGMLTERAVQHALAEQEQLVLAEERRL